MSFKDGETITIHCTDHETDATATIVDFRGGIDNIWMCTYLMDIYEIYVLLIHI